MTAVGSEQMRHVYLSMCRAFAAATDDPDAAALLWAEFTPAERETGQPQPGMTFPPPTVQRAKVVAEVSDPGALLDWVEEHHPEAVQLEMVVDAEPRRVHERGPYGEPDAGYTPVLRTSTRRVRPTFVAELLEAARARPDRVVPGIRTYRLRPRIVVQLTEPAAAIANHDGTHGGAA